VKTVLFFRLINLDLLNLPSVLLPKDAVSAPLISTMASLPATMDFSKMEEEINERWKEKEVFKFQNKLSQERGDKVYTFYDGPPFATGLPHYGHILAGTIKDVVTRFACMNGCQVDRRAGWDCHGLPVEYEMDQILGVKHRQDVLDMGIDVYNAHCRSIVLRYTGEWRETITRLGRWIDFDNDYKTMDKSYMESVWWVFSQLYKKGLVYQGYKVMPFSTACATPLSNFEAGLNYKQVKDPAIVVTFPSKSKPERCYVAWTTTPWTLPSNIALCVHPELDYVTILDKKSQKQYILAKDRICQMYPIMNNPKKYKPGMEQEWYDIVETCKGKDLVGDFYEPLFSYFSQGVSNQKYFQVVADSYVTADSGTGIVHQAPAFGEDDYRVCCTVYKIVTPADLPCPVDSNGCFTSIVTEWQGMYVKDADDGICHALKAMGRLYQKDVLDHSYPYCWRSDTPLIYKAVPSWFVAVEQIRDRIVENNKLTYWVPSIVKEGRFHNWLVDARDWAVSRNRFWGTPLPIWTNETFTEIICVESIQQLYDLSGVLVEDLHREVVDQIQIPSTVTPGTYLKRVDEVFDCWFESGSMPYAQQHYPFSIDEEKFQQGFPADFIAEGIDQTRGWFYTLMVLSTALFDKPAFKNLIVNGLVLAGDGQKMSKRKKNYPDPNLVISKYGADALRMYLINSPVVRAEDLKFQESGVLRVVKEVRS
jgi:isoleucyl-tRNA synthetase